MGCHHFRRRFNPTLGLPLFQAALQDAQIVPAGHAQGYAQCFEAFVADTYRAIEGERPQGLPTFEDGLRSARIVDRVISSARSRAWTTIG